MSAESLETRVRAAEDAAFAVPSNCAESSFSAPVLRVKSTLLSKRVAGAALFRVPRDYYDHPLAARAAILGCPIDRLCKTIVLENPAGTSTDPRAPLGTVKYIAVIIQYVAKLDTARLSSFVRARGGSADARLSLAEDGAGALTGFPFNGVCPVGLATAMPIIITKPLTQLAPPASVWLGGGEPDLKLRMFVSQLIREDIYSEVPGGVPVYTVDCAIPRDAEDVGAD